MEYLEILLPILFFTLVLMYINRSNRFNTSGKRAENSPADIFLKGILGIEVIVLIIILSLHWYSL